MIKQPEVLSRYLEHASPDTVYSWLENNSIQLRVWFRNDSHIVEIMLMERKEPLIDLALALFSRNRDTQEELYDRGDRTIQKAVLSNKNSWCDSALKVIVESKNTEYLEILLTSTASLLLLLDLFKKELIFENVSHEYWLILLEMASRNEHLRSFQDLDYYPFSKHDDLYIAMCELFNSLDATDSNAKLLAGLFEGLPVRRQLISSGFDIPELLKKWQNSKSVGHQDYLSFYTNPSADMRTTYDECQIEENYVSCRFHLARLSYWSTAEFNDFENSEDVALRMTFYRENDFNRNAGSYLTDEKLRSYYDKDRQLFVDQLIENDTIYYNETNQRVFLQWLSGSSNRSRFMTRLSEVENREKGKLELSWELGTKLGKLERDEARRTDELAVREQRETYMAVRRHKIQRHFIDIISYVLGVLMLFGFMLIWVWIWNL